jgi:hypothetical protein
MPIDVSPGIWVDEAKFIGRDAYNLAILGMERVVVVV